MTFAFYMNCVSAHQLPLARHVAARVGRDNFTYVDAGLGGQALQTVAPPAEVRVRPLAEASETLETADAVLTGLRDLALFERRARAGRGSFYYSERWFKPIPLCTALTRLGVSLPGRLRLLVPSYRRMARRFAALANAGHLTCFAIGPHAVADFRRLGVRDDRIVPWGYFVSPPTTANAPRAPSRPDRPTALLFVGRLLALKNVDILLRGLAQALKDGGSFTLTIVGEGPEESRLRRLAHALGLDDRIAWRPFQPPSEVRRIMREHDLLVFPSNGFDGWGAVVSEALEEGLPVVGSSDCGACPTLLSEERLFGCRDWKRLAGLLIRQRLNRLPPCSIGCWTASAAAAKIVERVI